MFMKSFNQTVDSYRAHLNEVRAGQLHLVDLDLDTGGPTRAGEYSLADTTYARLLRDLAKDGFQGITPELQTNLLAFFADLKPLQADMEKAKEKDRKSWAETFTALDKLKAIQTDLPRP
jgi:hypothetical protein